MYGSSATGAADTGEGYDSGRDLDHSNAAVRTGIVSWMNGRLRDCGFVGWRWDFAKGYGGRFVGLYNQLADGTFSVGEYWPSAPFVAGNSSPWATEIATWISSTSDEVDGTAGRPSRAFDFVLKGNLNNAFGWRNAANPTAYLGLWNLALLADANNLIRSNPSAAVTFIDNHDTGSTQQHWELDPETSPPPTPSS
jgi:alpha-amylase